MSGLTETIEHVVTTAVELWFSGIDQDSAPLGLTGASLPQPLWRVILCAAFVALPFAIWFFLGIEFLARSAEECKNLTRGIPKASVWGVIELAFFALLVLVLSPRKEYALSHGKRGDPPVEGHEDVEADRRLCPDFRDCSGGHAFGHAVLHENFLRRSARRCDDTYGVASPVGEVCIPRMRHQWGILASVVRSRWQSGR